MTLEEFSALLKRAAEKLKPEVGEALHELAPGIAELARSKIGHEQPGWPPLSDQTIEDKLKQGYPVPDPLLRTGKLRDSIVPVVTESTLAIGSADKTAEYQERGTSKIPPRPFLAPSLIESLPLVHRALLAVLGKVLTGR